MPYYRQIYPIHYNHQTDYGICQFVDTYTITFTDNTTYDFQIKNGTKGEKGDRGDVGGFINIKGVLANSSQLPTPESLQNLTVAYLVGAASPYDLYVQVGSTSSEAMWTNTGPFNAATAVSVNGNFQNIWDADTKQDKLVNTTNFSAIPVIIANSNAIIYQTVTQGAGSYSIPSRTSAGGLRANFDKSFNGLTTQEEKDQQLVNYGYLNERLQGLGGGGSLYLHKVNLLPKDYSVSNGYIANGFSLTLLSKNSTAITTIGELVAIRKNMLSFTGEYYTFDDANGLREIENLEISGTETDGYSFSVKYIDGYSIPPTMSRTSLSVSNYDIADDKVTEV